MVTNNIRIRDDKNPSNEHITKIKNFCYLIGDLHLENIIEIMDKHELISKNYQIKANIKPKNTLHQTISESMPEIIRNDDVIILSGGTNDLYSSKTKMLLKN